MEVSEERNPRQADRRERVELTIRSRGPAIRAEAAADDRYTALDLAFAKLESRLRRACDRRKGRHADGARGPLARPGRRGRPGCRRPALTGPAVPAPRPGRPAPGSWTTWTAAAAAPADGSGRPG